VLSTRPFADTETETTAERGLPGELYQDTYDVVETLANIIRGVVDVSDRLGCFERERPLTLEEIEERVEARDRDAVLDQARRRLDPERVAELEGLHDFQDLLARFAELLAGDR